MCEENNWSQLCNVHGKRRNRFLGERVRKVVYKHSSLNVEGRVQACPFLSSSGDSD